MSSNIWWLLLGVLIGWLIEWVIDWVYWRRRGQLRAAEAPAVRQADERAAMRDSLASAHADKERLQAELSAATVLAQQRQDTIEELKARLVRMPADDQRPTSGTDIQPSPAVVRAEDRTKAANFATVQLSREEIAALAPPVNQAHERVPLTNDTQLIPQPELPQPPAQRDPLIDINGIGPAYERKLVEAGVTTFAELAALTPERVRAIIAPQRWQEIDPAAWIAEARAFAQKKAAQ